MITRILKQTEETGIMTAVARDAQSGGQLVVLKRWECADSPLAQRAKDVAYYEHATEAFAQLRHPLLPRILDRFTEGKHYYAVMSYIDSESLEERSAKLLHPLSEQEIISYLNSLLNILNALEQHRPTPIRHNDISPANILIEAQRKRVFLTGFQVPPPPVSREPIQPRGKRTTRKLVLSPYLPIQDKICDQRSNIYALAASMHHILSNIAPPHYPNYPPIRLLNPSVSPALERILIRALDEDRNKRFQSYKEMQQELQRLL
jgi:serine/threonine protein kinase